MLNGKKLTSAKTARDPDSRINKSLRKWNCSYEPNGTPIMEEDKALNFVLDKLRKKHGKENIITKDNINFTVEIFSKFLTITLNSLIQNQGLQNTQPFNFLKKA